MNLSEVETPAIMLTRKTDVQEVRKSYGRVAWFYDIWSMFTESRAAKKSLQLADIRNGEIVLEVAVGTGLLFRKILALSPNGRNVGIDLTPAMLANAARRVSRHRTARSHLLLGNAASLPLGEGSFDLVLNHYMFDLLPQENFATVLAEFRRVLKPSGRVVIVTMAHGEKQVHRFWGWLAKRFPKLLAGCRPLALAPYLKQAGFTNIEVVRVSQNTFPSEILRADN